MAAFGEGYRAHVTGLFHNEAGRTSSSPEVADALLRRLSRKVEKAGTVIEEHFEESLEDAEILVVSFGCSAMSALSAVRRARREGVKAGILRLKTMWPFPEALVARASSRAKRILVPEMNLGQLALEVERAGAASGAASGGRVASVTRLGKVNGELFRPEEVYAAIMAEAAR